MTLQSITYQGGKSRIAALILDTIGFRGESPFYDLCCGSGAISLELVSRGFPPTSLYMLDASPWGLVWRMIGDGSFDLVAFRRVIDAIPTDPLLIQKHVEQLSKQPANVDTAYVFLILQAAAFGGKAIWIKNNAWQNTTFRSYWLPTETSSRRSPVNPMMPMPETIYERLQDICVRMRGVTAFHLDIRQFWPGTGLVYIDPAYAGTTGYGHTFDVKQYVNTVKVPCWVSEGKKMSDYGFKLDVQRSKGGISGNRKNVNEEWLSLVSPV